MPSFINVPKAKKRLIIFPSKIFSQSASLIAEKFATKKVRSNGKYQPRINDLILNLGGGNSPKWHHPDLKYFNSFESIKTAKNKLSTFRCLQEAGVSVPAFSTDIAAAREWINEGRIVVCRTLLESYGGRGITLARTHAELIPARLYVKYCRKDDEFRLHYVNKELVHSAQKKRIRVENETGNVNTYIRNLENNWVFCHLDLVVPQIVIDECQKAINALDLNWCAIDAIYNKKYNKVYILEANSAPGISSPTTLSKYCEALEKLLL